MIQRENSACAAIKVRVRRLREFCVKDGRKLISECGQIRRPADVNGYTRRSLQALAKSCMGAITRVVPRC